MIIRNTTTRFALVAAALALPLTGFAGDEPTPKDKTVIEKPVETQRFISGDLAVSGISQYISRGLVLNNQGVINQNYADLYLALYQSDTSFLSKVQLNLGIWFDLDPHSTQAGTATAGGGTTLPWFYEFDFTPGFSFTLAKIITISPSYYVFTSPASAFRTFEGLNINIGLDDTKFLGAFALHPSFTYLRELHNKAGDGADQGNYFEVGITPSVPLGPVTVSLPVTAGFGTDQFYGNNDGFGFVTPGVQVAVPLKFIPSAYGTYTFTTFYKFYYLGDDLSNFNTKVGPTPAGLEDNSVRKATHYEHVVSAGVTLTF